MSAYCISQHRLYYANKTDQWPRKFPCVLLRWEERGDLFWKSGDLCSGQWHRFLGPHWTSGSNATKYRLQTAYMLVSEAQGKVLLGTSIFSLITRIGMHGAKVGLWTPILVIKLKIILFVDISVWSSQRPSLRRIYTCAEWTDSLWSV